MKIMTPCQTYRAFIGSIVNKVIAHQEEPATEDNGLTLSKYSEISIDGILGTLADYQHTEPDIDIDTFDFSTREFANSGLLDGSIKIDAIFHLEDYGSLTMIESVFSQDYLDIVIFPRGKITGKHSLTCTLFKQNISLTGSVGFVAVSLSGTVSAMCMDVVKS